MQTNIYLTLFLAVSIFLISCGDGQYVNVRPGSENVNIASSLNEVKDCSDKGNNRVRITGYAERISSYIKNDLIQLSKNAAADVGANTIIIDEYHENGDGTQSATFNAFLCK
tara:strand:+ start:49582 stop:49917 length:336 start_codon:yes stop_codon:yes gene_type:complete